MRSRLWAGVAAVLLAPALMVGCADGSPADTPKGSGALPADTTGAPYIVQLDKATFKLSDRVIQKIKNGEELNFVYSISDAGQPVFTDAIKSGFEEGVAAAAKKVDYPIKSRLIGPVGGGNEKQVAEIRSLLNANQIDALVFNAAQPGPFVDVLNEVIERGIPVWGTGGDSPASNRIGFFSLNEEDAGNLAAQAVATWAKAENVDVRKAALFTGDPAGPWAQARMRGFVKGLTEAFPGVQFVNSVENPYNTSFDFPKVYSTAKAFIAGNPDVQVLFHTDQGVQMLGKAIADSNRTGKTFAAGFNLSKQILDYVESGDIVTTVGQNWHGQARTAAEAAVAFIFEGEVTKGVNYADPFVVTKENLADARTRLENGGA
ncbi:MAG TPA: substrate-binding domain-containing protein [Micromonosporaceae bacterium]|nr:substrate-binding domain-containing protein [Micromonosporaceae bacterium]